MEVKQDILWRVYVCFLGIVLLSAVIIGRVLYIQNVQGPYWRQLAKEQQQRFVPIEAERGTIYSEDGNMLSTSIPYFDIYIDFAAEGLREKGGKLFRDNVDSLSVCLASFFRGRTGEYKNFLRQGYRKKSRYVLLKRNLTFRQYRQLQNFPLVRLGKNKSGFIADVKSKRLNPFGLLANRTIGLARDYVDTDGSTKNTNVGLENTYDSTLRGESGSHLVKYLSAGVYVPVEGSEIEPENGNDILTTIDVNIQDIAENALLKMLNENECEYGTCIVMEVKTGKIKAIANLGRRNDGTYWEDLNYAIRASEPGSTFKLATLLALLEDKRVRLTDRVNIDGGKWEVNGRTVFDSEDFGLQSATVEEAFEHSSNVGMAKLAMGAYAANPSQFVDHLKRLHFNQFSGIDVRGETPPVVKSPSSKTWSATTLPWMSFGYEILVSPLQTLMLYNAVANNGTMMRPYLVNAIQKDGAVIRENIPQANREKICSDETLKQLRYCLEGVCSREAGTAYTLFKGSPYAVAGKTGTALVANGNRGYGDHIYQSSFAGYFPANDPQYSCIVVIKNKPFAKVYYGAKVAGPVFKEIADKLYALHLSAQQAQVQLVKDTSANRFPGYTPDIRTAFGGMQMQFTDSSHGEWAWVYTGKQQPILSKGNVSTAAMPDVRGMGLKDALYLLESKGMKVSVRGNGRVVKQNINAGTSVALNAPVVIELE